MTFRGLIKYLAEREVSELVSLSSLYISVITSR